MRIRAVTPWYPDYFSINSGVFVAQQVSALRDLGHEVDVDVLQIFPAPAGPVSATVVSAMRELAERSLDAMFPSDRGITYLPTPVPARGGPMGRANAMSRSLAMVDEYRPNTADVVHAHLGMPTGWAVSLARPKTPLVVTEHQSTLADVLDEPVAAAAYADVVRGASAFITVSRHLTDQIADALGGWVRDQIEVVPNIVDLTGIPFPERETPRLSSWIYVGGLMAHKGVQTLLRVFARYVGLEDPQATLTLVGQGPLRPWIEDYTAQHGISESVRLVGAVAHDQLGPLLADADVMVHLSEAETFGIAPLEAIGAGLPVVSLRNSGAVETWGDIETLSGLLLPLDSSPSQIVAAIVDLKDSTRRLDPVAARQTVVDRYSPESVANQLDEIYRRVVT